MEWPVAPVLRLGEGEVRFRFGHSVRRAFSEEDFPVNFSQRKNGFETESTPGKKNMSVNLTSYEIKTGIKRVL